MKVLAVLFIAVAISNIFLAYRVATDKIILSKSTQISLCIIVAIFMVGSALKYF